MSSHCHTSAAESIWDYVQYDLSVCICIMLHLKTVFDSTPALFGLDICVQYYDKSKSLLWKGPDQTRFLWLIALFLTNTFNKDPFFTCFSTLVLTGTKKKKRYGDNFPQTHLWCFRTARSHYWSAITYNYGIHNRRTSAMCLTASTVHFSVKANASLKSSIFSEIL